MTLSQGMPPHGPVDVDLKCNVVGRQASILSRGFSILLVCLLLCSCVSHGGLSSYGDVSMESPFAHLINQQFVTSQELYIYGEDGFELDKMIENYFILDSRISNRFILSKDVLEKGTVIRILKVEESTDHLLVPVRHFIVDVQSYGRIFDRPVHLKFDRFTVEGPEGSIQLNPAFFSQVK
ncbi:MAG: hypothetical protein AB7F75_08550 [Planctomycetota bacterium]